MPDSDTSSEINVNLYDNNGKIDNKTETKKSSDTDYYFNMIANQNKTVAEKNETESSSEIARSSESKSTKRTSSVKKDDSSESSDSSKKTNSSRERFETVNFGTPQKQQQQQQKQSFQNTSNSKSPSSSNNNVVPVTTQLTPQEVRMKKIELLRKLSEIKSKGFALTKEYDFNSSLEEMEYEFELLKSFVDKRNGIKVYKNILLNGVSIMEFLNEKYDPFDFHLEGWGEHMSVEVDSYDDVLEELYEKYKGTGKKMAPEVKLLLLLVASGSAFHFSKSQSSIPGLEAVISKNPELISKLLNPQKPKSQFMTQQEININKQRELIQQKEKELKQKQMARPPQQQASQAPPMMVPDMASMMASMTQKQPMMPPPMPTMSEPAPANQSRNKITSNGVPEIRAPENVQEILNRIRNQNLANNTDSIDDGSSNNERLLSDVNLSDSKKGKGKKVPMTKPSISVNI